MSAPNLDPEKIAIEHDLTPTATWRRGEMRRGVACEASGLNLSLGEALSSEAAVSAATTFVRRNPSLLSDVQAQAGTIQIDFGLMVGAEQSYAPSLICTPEELTTLAKASVSLVVSAYPVAE